MDTPQFTPSSHITRPWGAVYAADDAHGSQTMNKNACYLIALLVSVTTTAFAAQPAYLDDRSTATD